MSGEQLIEHSQSGVNIGYRNLPLLQGSSLNAGKASVPKKVVRRSGNSAAANEYRVPKDKKLTKGANNKARNTGSYGVLVRVENEIVD